MARYKLIIIIINIITAHGRNPVIFWDFLGIGETGHTLGLKVAGIW